MSMDFTFEEVIKKAKLVTLPDIYLRLKEILDEPDFNMAEVAIVISQDPAITIRLLNMVNSSLYGFSGKIETVGRAITLLGTQQVHDLVLATSVAQAFAGMSNSIMDMQRFWQHSLYCAISSRQLADLSQKCDKERLFVAGLLHDIGHLVMYQAIPEASQQTIIEAKKSARHLHEVEREIIGFDYTAVGGAIMHHLALPESLVETTLFHVEPAIAQNYPIETALVHLGFLLTKANEGDGEFNQNYLGVENSVWETTGLSAESCISIGEEVDSHVREIFGLFF